MSMLLYLMPVALFLGATGLVAFLWAYGSGQYEDLDGAAERILLDTEKPDDRR
jgi:cbb3-type cytochrome oxidase maturation protein